MTEATGEESPTFEDEGDLCPAEETVSPEDPNITVDGETFLQRLRRVLAPEVPELMDPSARKMVYKEFLDAYLRQAREQVRAAPQGGDVDGEADDDLQDQRDADGAIHFDDDDARVRPLPQGVPVPSADLVRKHRLSGHAKYKPWCAMCVRGACNAPAHRPRAELPAEGALPEVHCDYGFFKNKKGDVENVRSVLVMKDRKSGGFCADIVPRKGVGGGFAVKQMNRNLKKFGHHSKVLIRSDGEFAIRDLIDKLGSFRPSETIIENTPVGDSRANGRAERAVQSIEKQSRILKLATEEHFGSFGVEHPCFPWLVLHAADSINKYREDAQGKTAYEKIRGRPYSGIMFEFGTCILSQNCGKGAWRRHECPMGEGDLAGKTLYF